MGRTAFVFPLGASEVLTIFELAGNELAEQLFSELTLSGLLVIESKKIIIVVIVIKIRKYHAIIKVGELWRA